MVSSHTDHFSMQTPLSFAHGFILLPWIRRAPSTELHWRSSTALRRRQERLLKYHGARVLARSPTHCQESSLIGNNWILSKLNSPERNLKPFFCLSLLTNTLT